MRGSFRRLTLGFVAFVVACSSAPTGSVPSGPTTGPDIVIGSPMSLTGSTSKEGGLAKQGYELWLDWINSTQGGITVGGVKRKVRILYEDDQSKPDLSAQLMQKLITEENAQLLLGPYGSSPTASDAVVAEKNGIPMVEANGAAQAIFSKGYRFVFGVLSPADKYLKGVIDLAATFSPMPTRVAMLSADDSFSVEVAKAVEDYAPTKGMQIVFTQRYPNGSTDLSSLVAQAKATNPDLLLNSGHLAEAIAMHKAVKDLRVNAKLFAYSVGPGTPDFIQAVGKDADYVMSGSQWTPQVKYTPQFFLSVSDYVAKYKKMFNTTDDPAYQVAESTAACLALQKAIETVGTTDPAKVRDALAALDITTFFGQIKFDSRGANIYKPMVVDQIQAGQHHTVYPPEVADVKALYPAPSWDQR
jgi:branched-chain amino acid transport system substrate-binding protein